jgi:hypothetical protein
VNNIDKPKFFAKVLYKARARIEQMMGKIKRFKRSRSAARRRQRTRLRLHLDQTRHGLEALLFD